MQRIGFGYDSHRFTPGRALVLGGAAIPHTHGLAGHSDADAVLHALTDALLGSVAAGDIGMIFPDSDPQWKDAPSGLFVRHAVTLVRDKGCRVCNCDITIVTQSPRLAPYAAAMRQSIAELLGVDVEAVSVKAKTNEGMGWIGRGEGLAAMAAVIVASD